MKIKEMNLKMKENQINLIKINLYKVMKKSNKLIEYILL